MHRAQTDRVATGQCQAYGAHMAPTEEIYEYAA